MKFEFLHINSCQQLLPRDFNSVSLMRELDDYLRYLNEMYRAPEGSLIDRLVQRNINSSNLEYSARLLRYDMDVGQHFDKRTKKVSHEVKEYFRCEELKRSESDQRIVIHFHYTLEDGTEWTFSVPLQVLLKGWGDVEKGFQCYCHSLSNGVGPKEAGFRQIFYAGISSRNWLRRLDEHLYEVRHGSKKLFHRVWRDSLALGKVTYFSELIALNFTFEDALNWEEWFVDNFSLSPKGLNMIPGGKKGLKFLHEHKLTTSPVVSLEERERAIDEYLKRNPRAGVANPLISDLWKNDDYYLAVIGSREKSLSPEQVRQIRELTPTGMTPRQIMDKVGALNERQVINVMTGKTYGRVR